jgi:glycosyltransferase involved in cell wall biosynthesis
VPDGKRVVVVVPTHDEEKLIADTIRSIPDLVDPIPVVDDASRDGTVTAARGTGVPRVEVIEHERNVAVGAATLTGYRRALAERIDVTAVMVADAQMDLGDLETLADPVACGEVDFHPLVSFTCSAW